MSATQDIERFVTANEPRTGLHYDRWPSSLPQVTYMSEDGGNFCVTCANGGNGSEASTTTDDLQWKIVGAQINEEDTMCDHCQRFIISRSLNGF